MSRLVFSVAALLTLSAGLAAAQPSVETVEVFGTERMWQGQMKGLAWTSDGKSLISLSYDGVLSRSPPDPAAEARNTLVTWDVTTRKVKQRFPGKFQHIDLSADGTLLLTVRPDRTLVLWRMPEGRGTWKASGVDHASLSADGQRVLTSKLDKAQGKVTLTCRAAVDGKVQWKGTVPGGKTAPVFLSPSGDRFVLLREQVELWGCETQAKLHALGAGDSSVNAVRFTPDGKRVAVGTFDKALRVYDAASGELVHDLKGHKGFPLSLDVSPDGAWLACGDRRGAIRLWNLETGAEGKVLKGVQGGIGAVAFSPDGASLASGTAYRTTGLETGSVRVWDVASGAERGAVGHSSGVRFLGLSSNGKYLHSVGYDLRVLAWKLSSPRSPRVVATEKYSQKTYLFAPNAVWMANCEWRQLVVRGVRKGKEVLRLKLEDTPEELAVDPKGLRLAAGAGKQVLLIDTKSGKTLKTLTVNDDVQALAFLGSHEKLACAERKAVHVLDPATGEAVYAALTPPEGKRTYARSILADAAGKHLFVNWNGLPIQVHEAQTGKLLGTWGTGAPNAVSLDGTLAASVHAVTGIALRDPLTGKVLAELPSRHQDKIQVLAFGPNGDLFSGGDDGVILRWKLKR